MSGNHAEYNQALEDYAKERVDYVFLDIHEELDNIERTLETESSKILLNWVRDSILRVSDNYKI
jgi:glutaredoxin-related protein